MDLASDEPVEFKLRYPIKYDGKIYDSLTIKPPKAKHIKKLGKEPSLEDFMSIASKCSGVSMTLLDELRPSDVVKLSAVIGSFFEDGPEIMPS